MPRRRDDDQRHALVQGTLDMLILQTLRRGTQHGYGIGQTIHDASDGAFQVETGSLYPALHRLERRGWIASDWRTSEKGQRAKFYRLTPAGRRQLVREHSRWQQLVNAVAALMRTRGSEAG
jgi:transcriptional regulator